MKVLFAVNNDKISEAMLKTYQKNYKQILSYKNVYYFNAILKELQKDKTYDRVVISEDLEPFANNNYDTIDKFIFEKLDKISDEATKLNGDNIEVILICSDRRAKSDEILAKFFSIGIYNAIIGKDRSIDEVVKLIYQPRNKKDAKIYYKIESNNALYQAESENNVSEAEVQNILAHYRRLGKNEDKFVDSFNNIVSQYTDAQLKIIIRYLPMNVKAVLEERSPKYQELTTFSKPAVNQKKVYNDAKQSKNAKTEKKIDVKMLENQSSKAKITKPIVIPSSLNTSYLRKVEKPIVPDEVPEKVPEKVQAGIEEQNKITDKDILDEILDETFDDEEKIEIPKVEIPEIQTVDAETVKRGRGRPRKNPVPVVQEEDKPKRGRGRPKKVVEQEPQKIEETVENNDVLPTDEEDDFDLFNLNNEEKATQEEDVDLFGLMNEEENNASLNTEENEQEEDLDLFSLDIEEETKQPEEPQEEIQEENQDEIDLFDLDLGTDDNKQDNEDVLLKDDENIFNNDDALLSDNLFNSEEPSLPQEEFEDKNEIMSTNSSYQDPNLSSLLTKDKKVVAFVGTTKNGTSFIVNNTAELLSSMGIQTAILDMTNSKNAYYIYTKNEETLRTIAVESIDNLQRGVAKGIKVNKKLDVFVDLPGEQKVYNDNNIGKILETLLQNFDAVLIDCDFNTPIEVFDKVQEIYLVQSMDVLTIQPLTAFLRNLKSKNVLRQEKLKIVINKEQKVRSLSVKTLIGGIAFYNDPSMSFMTELFNKDTIPYCKIPFEVQNYTKYLDSLVNCEITLNGYSKQFMYALRELADMVYPLVNKSSAKNNKKDINRDHFSSETNATLNKMKNNY